MLKLDNETLLLVFVVVTGVAVVLQAILLLAIFVLVRKTAKTIREEAENLHSSLMPVLYDTRDTLASTQGVLTSAQEFLTGAQEVFTRVSPKIEAATGELAEIAHGLRVQSAEMQSAATEVVERVKRQCDRADEMVTGLLNTVDRAGGFVANAVSRPVRQLSGMLGSVKAVVESLRGSAARH